MAFIQDYEQTVQASPTNRPQTFVNLSQNENGRQLIFHIIGVSIPAGSIATLSGTKPDGVVYSTTGTIDGDFVTIAEDTQMTAVAGAWDAKIHIVNGGNEIASALVRFVIEKDPVDAGAIPSDSQLDGIVAECQAYAEAARSSAYGSPLTAATAAAMIDQTRVYVYTGSETGYTAGHWYYYDGSAWTDGGTYNSAAIQTDPTLAIPGMAADSKAVGDAIAAEAAERAADIDDVKEDLEQLEPGLSAEAKAALLACFAHVAWTDTHGQDYYDDLEDALYANKELVSISAVFNAGNNYIYTDDTLDSLKQYMTVTALYNDGTTKAVTSYTLSGTLVKGSSVITVIYQEKTTTVTVTDVVDFYNNNTWSYAEGGKNNLIRENRGGYSSGGHGVYTSGAGSTTRGFFTERGLSPVQLSDTKESTDFYPIPVPPTATKVTVTLADSTQVARTILFTHDSDETLTDWHYDYVKLQDYKATPYTMTFTAGANQFISFMIKEAGATGDIVTEPEINVVFA